MPEVYSTKKTDTHKTVTNMQNMYKGTTVIPSLKEVVENNNMVLFQLKSVFPFDFFPASITIDLQKISIVDQLFFFSKQVISIPISEIFVVECDTNLFFATLRIRDKRYELSPLEISFLHKEEARKARRIIQGLIAVNDQNLNMGGLSLDEIKENVEKLGSTLAGST